jgi:hypothetical protein
MLISERGNLRTKRAEHIKCSSNKIGANERSCLSYYNNAPRPTIIRHASLQVCSIAVENSGQTHLKPSAASNMAVF